MQTVFTYETDTQKLLVKRTEIYRYLGYKTGMTINCEMEDMIEEILQNVLKGSSAKVCYKRFPIVIDEEIDFGFMRVKSKELKANLKDCNEVVIFAATIGLYTDRQIQKESILSPARALIYQAVGAAVVEALCDAFNKNLEREEQEKGNFVRPRYSPGYGDVSLTMQKDILRELDCAKRIGITLSDSYLMIPEKSVTAFVGIKKQDK